MLISLQSIAFLAVAGILCLQQAGQANALPSFPEHPTGEAEVPDFLPIPSSVTSRFQECQQMIGKREWFQNCWMDAKRPVYSKKDSWGVLPCTDISSLNTNCVFTSPVHLKQFIWMLDRKYGMLARPRFGKRSGKRSPSSMGGVVSPSRGTALRSRSKVRYHGQRPDESSVQRPTGAVTSTAMRRIVLSRGFQKTRTVENIYSSDALSDLNQSPV